MSQYFTIEANLVYPDQESFDKMMKTLRDGGWLTKDNFFCSESDCQLDDTQTIFPERFEINIPCYCYRNLGRLDFFQMNEGQTKVQGQVIITTNDGQFHAWVIKDGVQTSYDLCKWAEENGMPEPNKSESDNYEQYQQDQIDWEWEVQHEFICEHN